MIGQANSRPVSCGKTYKHDEGQHQEGNDDRRQHPDVRQNRGRRGAVGHPQLDSPWPSPLCTWAAAYSRLACAAADNGGECRRDRGKSDPGCAGRPPGLPGLAPRPAGAPPGVRRDVSADHPGGGEAARSGRFEDRDWVERWDAVFAHLYLEALHAEIAGDRRPSRPWRLAFTPVGGSGTGAELRRLLLGINAHVNYDLPQSLLASITDDEFADPELIASRRRDHERIDAVLASRVSAEDAELGGRRGLRDRLLTPLNRQASRRFLREARLKVWHNAIDLRPRAWPDPRPTPAGWPSSRC